MWHQFETNHREVTECFGNFVFNYNSNSKSQGEAANDICTMLKLRFSNSTLGNAKLRVPKVFLIGPPGSGRTTQAEEMS